MEQCIRFYKRDDEGELFDTRDDCTIDDVCGTVPRVGDLIVSRWLRDSKEEPRVWWNRTVSEVEAVYFLPYKRRKESDDAWVVVVIKDRQMTEAEWSLL